MPATFDFDALRLGPANVYWPYDPDTPADSEFLGIMGDDLGILMATETAPLTGAQFGTIRLNAVVVGGRMQIRVPFKEISPDKFAKAFPNSKRYTATGPPAGDGVLFIPRVGLRMRDLAAPLRIAALVGGEGAIESVAPTDIFDFYLASPADAGVEYLFSPTEQVVLVAMFDVWPDEAHGNAWGYNGPPPDEEALAFKAPPARVRHKPLEVRRADDLASREVPAGAPVAAPRR